jgi:hypothetical protein
MKVTCPFSVLSAMVVLALGVPSGVLASACLVSVEELQTATDRTFSAGQEGKAVDGSPLCVYAEAAAPTRKLIINVLESRGKAGFESRLRLLNVGKKEIGLKGVGDAAYYNGTSAGVLTGDRLIAFSGVRRAASKDIPPERIVALLQAAVVRAAK